MEIKSLIPGNVLFSADVSTWRELVELAVKQGAYLGGAYLEGANLEDANLKGANLNGAYLEGAIGIDLVIAKTRIIPQEGSIVGWKKLQNGVLAKVLIPDGIPRSHAFGRKCRAERVQVLALEGANIGVSRDDGKTVYRVGETVICHLWETDWRIECAGGIHFFITKEEAQDYDY